jgi:hypothetical protein
VRLLGDVRAFTVGGSELGIDDVCFLADDIASVTTASPKGPRLSAAFPNPCNPRTEIRYELDRPGPVRLHVIDLRGRLVRSLVDESSAPQGVRTVAWDGRDDSGRKAATGVYFFMLVTESGTASSRVALIK